MNEIKYIHYVYITTNLINGKQYVGDHTINPKQKKYYLGSGKTLLEPAIKKYGSNNFFKEILEWFPTRYEASLSQEKYIKKFNTLHPNGYNISPKGGIGIQGCHSQETKEKIGNSLRGRNYIFTEQHLQHLKGVNKGNKFWEGKHHTEEAKKRMSISAKNRKSISEETRKKLCNRVPWNKGKIGVQKHSQESIDKMKLTQITNKKNKGKNNGMYKKSIYTLWCEKYGQEIAKQKLKKRNIKFSKSIKRKNYIKTNN